jgi:phosphoglycolate phosphatase
MIYDCLIFDLDGTLSDPKQGIVRSLNYALSAFDFPTCEEDELTVFIGPPLDYAFKQLTQSEDASLISSLVAKYRERYADIGYAENVLYEGIPVVLAELAAEPGTQLGVCTSKRVDFAEQILDMFGIRALFKFVDGGEVGVAKEHQLRQLLSAKKINRNSLMIGDRKFDLVAAEKNCLSSAGVLWGYGSRDELEQYKPALLLSEPKEMLELL